MSTRRRAPGGLAAHKTPDFRDPPVVEVALSVGFQPIGRLGVIKLAELWDTKFRASMPIVEEQPPIMMSVEPLGSAATGPAISFQVMSDAPLPRLWFKNADESKLVQVQNNWFARNWRRQGATSGYPRYPTLRNAFRKDLLSLQAFLHLEGLGDLRPTQCEVSYINHIGARGNGGSPKLSSVLSLVDDRPSEFDHPLESLRLAATFAISQGGSQVGRLHVAADPAIRRADQQSITVLTITARGIPIGKGVPGVIAFLDLGRQSAFDAFVGLTRGEMHRIWGRTRGR